MKVFQPNSEPQYQFLTSDVFEVLYGGAAGGGKTQGLIVKPLIRMQQAGVRNWKGIIFRNTYREIEGLDGLAHKAREIYAHIPGAQYLKQSHTWTFPTPVRSEEELEQYRSGVRFESYLQFGYLESYEHALNHQGLSYNFIGFDELGHQLRESYLYLISRLGRDKGIPAQVASTANPGTPWVFERWAYWLDVPDREEMKRRSGVVKWYRALPDRDGEEEVPEELVEEYAARYPKNPPRSRTFIHADFMDNPDLSEDYIASLMMQPYIIREQLVNSNWKIQAGRGLVFKREWFTRTALDFPPGCQMFRYWDFAATAKDGGLGVALNTGKKKSDPDFTATCLMGIKGNDIYIKVDRMQLEWPAVQSWFLRTAKSEPGVRIGWEQEPGSNAKGLSYNLRLELGKIGRSGTAIPANVSKLQNAMQWSTEAENGQIIIIESTTIKTTDLIACFHGFPELPHDDETDAVSGARRLARSSFTGSQGVVAQ